MNLLKIFWQFLNPNSQAYLFLQLRYEWKAPIGLIKKYGFNYVRNDIPRLSGCVSISFLIHIVLIVGYFGLAELETPVEPPIKEISFIDLSEEQIELAETKELKKLYPVKKNHVVIEEPELIVNSNVAKTNNNISLGRDRLFLDSERKQVPIKVDRLEPVAEKLRTPVDLLKLSIAKGIGKDNRVARSSQIDLTEGKKLNVASNREKSGITTIVSQNDPEIKFSGQILQQPTTNQVISLKSTVPQIDLDNTNMKPKSTQTYITGPLANRTIIEKTIPGFPLWAKMQGVGASVSLKFTVMENGTVKENIIIERTSGSSEWDRLVVQSLKKWKFAALSKSDIRHDQTGVITFQFVI
ncbi:MAG: energy transducer TonB family protein [Candidatus Hodarchaeales archaeon]|jgi:TonB family protein